jgi:hypothetical protein
MDELRPCPFCGSNAEINPDNVNFVNCSRLGCCLCVEWNESGVHWTNWNTRPIEDALRASNEELKHVCAKVLKLYSDVMDPLMMAQLTAALAADKGDA